ncbi:hypothetical protein Tsubulata_026931, partial [Turnera subulata]
SKSENTKRERYRSRSRERDPTLPSPNHRLRSPPPLRRSPSPSCNSTETSPAQAQDDIEADTTPKKLRLNDSDASGNSTTDEAMEELPADNETTKSAPAPTPTEPEAPKISYQDMLSTGHSANLSADPWFDEEEKNDYLHVLVDGPWGIYGNVLSVQPWSPEFKASSDRIDSVVVWTQYPDFPVNRYHSEVFNHLGNMVGKTVKLDGNTRSPSRAKFAKVAVCVDLTKPLKGTVYLEGTPIRVRYEGLPNLCYICGKNGHSVLACSNAVKEQGMESREAAITQSENSTNRALPSDVLGDDMGPASSLDGRGEWMTVPRRIRRTVKRSADGIPSGSNIGHTGGATNRFQALTADQLLVPGPTDAIKSSNPIPKLENSNPSNNSRFNTLPTATTQTLQKRISQVNKSQKQTNLQATQRKPLNDISNLKPDYQPKAQTGQASSSQPHTNQASSSTIQNQSRLDSSKPKQRSNHSAIALPKDSHTTIVGTIAPLQPLASTPMPHHPTTSPNHPTMQTAPLTRSPPDPPIDERGRPDVGRIDHFGPPFPPDIRSQVAAFQLASPSSNQGQQIEADEMLVDPQGPNDQ